MPHASPVLALGPQRQLGRQPSRLIRAGEARSASGRHPQQGPVEFALDEELRGQILAGSRGRRLRNVSIKLDPVQIPVIWRLSSSKRRSIPVTHSVTLMYAL